MPMRNALALALLALSLAVPGRSSAQTPPPESPTVTDAAEPSALALPTADVIPSLAVASPAFTHAGIPSFAVDAPAGAGSDSFPSYMTEKSFKRAALEVTGVNVFVWMWCRYIREGGTNVGFRISPETWKDNLLNGFEWDDNHFSTNQLAHPYHGSMYFASARANGFDYWESTAFSFAGSAMWEYFGEAHNASLNDWISTGYGGVAFGEMLHRFSAMVLDNRAVGAGRVWREIGGLAINPMGEVNRLVTGEMSHVGPNLPGRDPGKFRASLRAGPRFTGEHSLTNSDTTRGFVRLRGLYGDQAAGEIHTPFDAFSFDIQLNFKDKSAVGRAQIQGVLRSWEIARGEQRAAYFAFMNYYDYIDTWAYVYGGQSVGAMVLTRRGTELWTFDAGLGLNWIILGGTSSDYASYTGRGYDYGPGVGARFFALLRRHGYIVLGAESDAHWLRILNGTEANHLVRESKITAGWPLLGQIGVGAEYTVYNAERNYRDYPDVSTRAPQLLAYLAFNY